MDKEFTLWWSFKDSYIVYGSYGDTQFKLIFDNDYCIQLYVQNENTQLQGRHYVPIGKFVVFAFECEFYNFHIPQSMLPKDKESLFKIVNKVFECLNYSETIFFQGSYTAREFTNEFHETLKGTLCLNVS